MMTDWYQKSLNTLQLNGKAERTQEAYTRAVRMLSTFYEKSPDEITEPELEAYFLRRRNVDHWSANTMRICYCGSRFFFVQVLQRNWHLFDILRAKNEGRLPAVLSREEVHRVKARIELAQGFVLSAPEPTIDAAATLRCRHCGGVLRFRRLVWPGDVASLVSINGEPEKARVRH